MSSLHIGLIVVAILACGGCFPSSQQTGPTVDQMIEAREGRSSRQRGGSPAVEQSARQSLAAAPGEKVLATIDGAPISQAAVTDLLMRAHGVGILDQLIGLQTAQGLAESKGLTIDQSHLDSEYEIALSRLVDPLSSVNPQNFDKPAAERLLDNVLTERNMSRAEFNVVLRRNAYLRKIVYQQQVFSEEDLRAEYERSFGRRVQVRHIQLGSQGDVAEVQERLAAGEDFGELAVRYSANASAKRQGLLEPFSATESDLPDAFRQVAFSLQPEQVSRPLRIGAWEHLIKLEKVIEPQPADFAASRNELTQRLRERLADAQMQQLHENLFRAAKIEIQDPVLRDAFYGRHPELKNAGGR